MSRIYDTVEPAVIDETLLRQCVEEQGPTGEAGKIAKREGVDFKDVRELRLDFKNILKIDNLWRFASLTKLQLDNNIIEKIQGLEALVNLQWLDLSFNNIEVVEGLDSLTQLKDLTLFNNRISALGNMDSMTQLQVFSIGNNKLERRDDLLYLRRFKKLNTLNLNGNPLCEMDLHYEYTIAHLTTVVYLDYQLVDSDKRTEAMKQFDSIEQLASEEEELARKLEEEEKYQAERELHKEAYVEDLNGPQLFCSLFAEDAEAPKLAMLPDMGNMLGIFQEAFTKVSMSLFEFGLADCAKRNSEIELFRQAHRTLCENNRNKSIEHIKKFEEVKARVYTEMISLTDHGMIEVKVAQLSDQIQGLWDELMSLEMQLVDQLEESIKDFERNLSEMFGSFIETVQEYINQFRELENQHHEKLSEVAVTTLEKVMKNELEEELSEEAKNLFVDKDTVMNAVIASHEHHTIKIDNKEDDITTRANRTVQLLIENIHNEEIKRNRARVCEINTVLDQYRDELDNKSE